MTTHATHHPTRAQQRPPRTRHPSLALPPAEAFCNLDHDSYLDYARAQLPPDQAHQLVCSLLGELALGSLNIDSNPTPLAQARRLVHTRPQRRHSALPRSETASSSSRASWSCTASSATTARPP